MNVSEANKLTKKLDVSQTQEAKWFLKQIKDATRRKMFVLDKPNGFNYSSIEVIQYLRTLGYHVEVTTMDATEDSKNTLYHIKYISWNDSVVQEFEFKNKMKKIGEENES